MGYTNYVEVRIKRADGTTRVIEARGPREIAAAKQVAGSSTGGYSVQGYNGSTGARIDDM